MAFHVVSHHSSDLPDHLTRTSDTINVNENDILDEYFRRENCYDERIMVSSHASYLWDFCEIVSNEFTKMLRTNERDSLRSVNHNNSTVEMEYKMTVEKVEFSTLDDDDLVGWIVRAETYFEVHG